MILVTRSNSSISKQWLRTVDEHLHHRWIDDTGDLRTEEIQRRYFMFLSYDNFFRISFPSIVTQWQTVGVFYHVLLLYFRTMLMVNNNGCLVAQKGGTLQIHCWAIIICSRAADWVKGGGKRTSAESHFPHALEIRNTFLSSEIFEYLNDILLTSFSLLRNPTVTSDSSSISQVIHPSPEPAGMTSFLAVSLLPDSCPDKTGEFLSVPIGSRKVRLETDWKITGIVRKHPTGIRQQRTSQKRLGNGRKRRKPVGSDTEIAETGRLFEVPATGLIDLGCC